MCLSMVTRPKGYRNVTFFLTGGNTALGKTFLLCIVLRASVSHVSELIYYPIPLSKPFWIPSQISMQYLQRNKHLKTFLNHLYFPETFNASFSGLEKRPLCSWVGSAVQPISLSL